MTTHAISRAQQDGFEDRARRAFAVRAANRNHRTFEFEAERIADLPDAGKTHIDTDWMCGFEVREPRGEGWESNHGGVFGLRGWEYVCGEAGGRG